MPANATYEAGDAVPADERLALGDPGGMRTMSSLAAGSCANSTCRRLKTTLLDFSKTVPVNGFVRRPGLPSGST
jgi:hypothetical protein